MDTANFLVEIGTEELPPKALKRLSDSFTNGVCKGFDDAGLTYGSTESFATPRRLAILVTDLEKTQPDKSIKKFGPAVKAAFDESGEPTPAALGFAKSCGVEIDQLGRSEQKGIEKLSFEQQQKGSASSELIPGIVSAALGALPIPKRMRWGSSRNEFVRPVHWVVLLLDNEIVKADILGVPSSNESRGHRFHHDQEILVHDASDYESVLEETGNIIPSFQKRMQVIEQLLLAEGEKHQARVDIDSALLEEVTALVEYPVALTGSFDSEFLEVPSEALVLAMKSHQKYFCMWDMNDSLLPSFVAISNIQSRDPEQVIKGNERVIRPRLADARFFYETDRKRKLEEYFGGLEKIVFQNKLGTVAEKSRRVAELAAYLAGELGESVDRARRAAILSKCDLLTSMVDEFADLQGVMGKYYAEASGEDAEVAQAIKEQYKPAFAGDSLPQTRTGAILALADKLDTMVGLFAIGQPPTGSKDPFALRRSAIGVLRILVELEMPLDLAQIVKRANLQYNFLESQVSDVEKQLVLFMLDRFRAWYSEDGVPQQVIQSVFELQPTSPLDFHQRVNAVAFFNALPDAQALAAANKRVSNILSKSGDQTLLNEPDESLFSEEAEIGLFKQLVDIGGQVDSLLEDRNYQGILETLATLRPAVDRFFDEVLVMSDDDTVRNHRLSLLNKLRKAFLQVADISCLDLS